jgi:glutamate-ammonia-ligase adenylyltransferase
LAEPRPPGRLPGEHASLWRRIRVAPRIENPATAQRRFDDLFGAGAGISLRFLGDERVRRLITSIADHSSYLWMLIAADRNRFLRLLSADPENHLDQILGALDSSRDVDEDDIMRRLRLAKQEIALLIAIADLGGVWSLEEVMQALSQAGETVIKTALRHLLRMTHQEGKLALPDPDDPERGSGIVVLALGKLGGLELNYSSDVDLIVVFDPDSAALPQSDDAKPLFVRMVQGLVRLLQQATTDGYVVRVDLRLRPDPGSTAVAISKRAALLYYESCGENWERAALIKARPIAGDLDVGRAFIADLAPFVWRRYFDFGAIADIHAMKRRIHAAKGGGDIAVAGHNVKLGRGGIREIEFFVQTQQLIFGGKRPELRGSRTLPMLRRLRDEGWIGGDAVSDLTKAYDFLRRIEHRLQMIGDHQTHRLPESAEALKRFAAFCGFSSTTQFSRALTRNLERVVHHYGLLFENAPVAEESLGQLVFTGTEVDDETLQTLVKLGYDKPTEIGRTVRDWCAGRRGGVRSARARSRLNDLLPKLLTTFAGTDDPDGAVAAFDAALEQMPAAAELFAILAANASLLNLFGDVLGGAPRLAGAVMMRPHLLDVAIDTRAPCLADDVMDQRLTTVLARTQSTEEHLDAVRDAQHEEHFLIGLALLKGDMDPAVAGQAYSTLAVGVIRVVLREILASFALEHGTVPGGVVAVVAMGKLGSREMTATSDLDLVLLYDFDAARPESDGRRPLHATRYYTRVTQRLVSHLTVATRRGRLYDVDMRLRPSGGQGPLATKLSAFVPYQRQDAEPWERMALTRARVIAGDAMFRVRVEDAITALLRRPPDTGLRRYVSDMRALIAKEKPPVDAWDLKLLPGGLIDLEFIAQVFVLENAAKTPAIIEASTRAILQTAGDLGLLGRESADRLIDAHRLFTTCLQVIRFALADGQAPAAAVQGGIAAAVDVPPSTLLPDAIAAARAHVSTIFEAFLDETDR